MTARLEEAASLGTSAAGPSYAAHDGAGTHAAAPSRRRLRRWLLALVVLALGVTAVQATMRAAAARRALEEARRTMRAASAHASSSLTERLPLLDRASALTEEATRLLSGWPLGAVARLPVLGRDARVARSIAESGGQVARAARVSVVAMEPLAAGRVTGNTLAAASDALLRLGLTLERAHRTVSASDPLILAAAPRREFLTEAWSARRSAGASGRALGLASGFYGAPGSVRYFLAFQNPAELRGTGGLIGQYGIIESSPDGPRLVSVRPIGALQERTRNGVPLPEHLTGRYARFGVARDWTAVNVPPDFPTVGRIIVDLYARTTGVRVDGVVALDPLAGAKLLEAAGPITVDGQHIDAANAAEITMVRAYERYASDNEARSRFLEEVARETFAAFVRGLHLAPIATLERLGEAARGRHIQAYASDPADEDAFEILGIDGGASPPENGDYLMPVGLNIAGNKMDAFLRREIRYEVRLQGDGGARTRASLTLHNEAGRELPEYVQGPHDARFRPGENRQFQTLYLADGYSFTRATLNGRPTLAEAQFELGALALTQEIRIDRGNAATLAYELRRTGAARILSGRMTYRLFVRPQATATPDQLEIQVAAPPGWRFAQVPFGFLIDGNIASRDQSPLVAEESFEFALVRPQ